MLSFHGSSSNFCLVAVLLAKQILCGVDISALTPFPDTDPTCFRSWPDLRKTVTREKPPESFSPLTLRSVSIWGLVHVLYWEIIYSSFSFFTVLGMLNFCANNYLGLSSHPEVVQAGIDALKTHGAGLSSVRFICGTQVRRCLMRSEPEKR